MMPFAVTIEGVTAEGQARWVLAVYSVLVTLAFAAHTHRGH